MALPVKLPKPGRATQLGIRAQKPDALPPGTYLINPNTGAYLINPNTGTYLVTGA